MGIIFLVKLNSSVSSVSAEYEFAEVGLHLTNYVICITVETVSVKVLFLLRGSPGEQA